MNDVDPKNQLATEALSELLQRNLTKSPELAAKQKRLLDLLAKRNEEQSDKRDGGDDEQRA